MTLVVAHVFHGALTDGYRYTTLKDVTEASPAGGKPQISRRSTRTG